MTVDQLVEQNAEWAYGIARKVKSKLPPSFDIEDLEQIAIIEVWMRAQTFDESRGVPFRGYAYLYVLNAVRMAIRRRSYTAATGDELASDYADSRPSQEADLQERQVQEQTRWRDSKRRRRTAELMDKLPHYERFLIKRVYLDGDDVVDLAAAWWMDAGLLKKRLRGGVRMLMKLRRAK